MIRGGRKYRFSRAGWQRRILPIIACSTWALFHMYDCRLVERYLIIASSSRSADSTIRARSSSLPSDQLRSPFDTMLEIYLPWIVLSTTSTDLDNEYDRLAQCLWVENVFLLISSFFSSILCIRRRNIRALWQVAGVCGCGDSANSARKNPELVENISLSPISRRIQNLKVLSGAFFFIHSSKLYDY